MVISITGEKRRGPAGSLKGAGTGHADSGHGEFLDAMDFDSIVREHGGRLYNLAFKMLGDAQEAEDAVQDIFLKAYRARKNFRGDSAVYTWLYRIAVNSLNDHLKKRKRSPAAAGGYDFCDWEKAGAVSRGSESAEDGYVRDENMGRIREAILDLPPKYRAVFVLNVIEGYSHREIAKILGISPGTARVARVRAAKKIRESLEKSG